MNIITNITLMFIYMINSIRMVVLLSIVVCMLDYLAVGGVKSRLDIYFLNFYDAGLCIRKLIVGVFATIVLFLAGLFISKYREYYKKQEQA